MPIEETVKLESGERELYKIRASMRVGYTGLLILTSERIVFSGKRVFTGKPIRISIPFEKLIEIKNPERPFVRRYQSAELQVWFMDENGLKRKITFNQKLFHDDTNNIFRIGLLFSFIYRLHADKELQSRVKRGEQVAIVEPGIKITNTIEIIRHFWIYFAAFLAGAAIGGTIPILVSLGLAHLVVRLLDKHYTY